MQVERARVIERREERVGPLEVAALGMGGRGVVGDRPQHVLLAQRAGQPAGDAILDLHVLEVKLVAVAVAQADLGREHHARPALPRGQLIGLSEEVDCRDVVLLAALVGHRAGLKVCVRAGVEPEGVVKAPLCQTLQAQQPPVEKDLELGLHRPGGLGEKPLEQRRLRHERARRKVGREVGELRGERRERRLVKGEEGIVAAVQHVARTGEKRLVVVPCDAQALEQGARDLRAGVGLAALDLGQVRDSADAVRKALEAPVAREALAADERTDPGDHAGSQAVSRQARRRATSAATATTSQARNAKSAAAGAVPEVARSTTSPAAATSPRAAATTQRSGSAPTVSSRT